jgi:hypothetical protein
VFAEDVACVTCLLEGRRACLRHRLHCSSADAIMVIIALAAVKGAVVVHKKMKQADARTAIITTLPGGQASSGGGGRGGGDDDWWGGSSHESYRAGADSLPSPAANPEPGPVSRPDPVRAASRVEQPVVDPFASRPQSVASSSGASCSARLRGTPDADVLVVVGRDVVPVAPLSGNVVATDGKAHTASVAISRARPKPRPKPVAPVDDGSFNHAMRSKPRRDHCPKKDDREDPAVCDGGSSAPIPALATTPVDFGSFNHAMRSTPAATSEQRKGNRRAQSKVQNQTQTPASKLPPSPGDGSFNHAVLSGAVAQLPRH